MGVVGAARRDEEQLLRVLHDTHAPALWRYTLGLTGGDRGRAEDVVQETMVRAWRHLGVLRSSDAAVRSWLFTVARNIVIDRWRTPSHRREVLTDEPVEQVVADPSAGVVDHQVIVAALGRLSPEHRAALLECYVRGASVAQAAAALGVAEGTVKSRLHYGLRALRLAADEMGIDL